MRARYGQSLILVALLASLAGSTGCATPEKRTAIGAGGGAGAGALVGGLAGGWQGAAIGAGVGALAGGAIGNYLDKQQQDLQKVADAKRTQNGILVNLKNDLLFDTGSTQLKPQAQTQLTQLGDILAKYPDDRIRIEGYTDATGGQSFNELLSKQRAQTVADSLTSRGVKAQQITTSGLGPLDPVASNKTAQGRAQNRRVELHIDVPGKAQG